MITGAARSRPQGQTSDDWSRNEWAAYADRILAGIHAWASPSGARITPPGAEGGYGHAVDGLEGFARSFLLAGFRMAGEPGPTRDALAAFYARGIAAGVDPDSDERWVRLDEHPQAKVEAASIALVLDLTRPYLWDTLDAITQQRVIEYFAPVVGDPTYPRNNWVWFRLVVQTFLRSVGGPWSPEDVAADLARHDSFVRADGWLSDGDERAYDHYVGWALHVYPVLWSRMQGASDLANGRTASDILALDRYLLDAIALVGADGSPLIQGRSLIYRFAVAAPFWVGILAEVPSLSAAQLAHAATSVVRHFAEHDVPDTSGLLTLGWYHEWRQLAQSYSGPASPYWAAKGFIGLMLPADHPVWTTTPEPLPVESNDVLRVIAAPGWVVSGTVSDGIVRVVNHGTDHALEHSLVGDSPLYAQLGYSTATSPLLDEAAWRVPLEQSVALVDATGRSTHRSAIEPVAVRLQDDERGHVGVGTSAWQAHWLTPDPIERSHGSGREGQSEVVGRITVTSLVRGAWEVRLARVDSLVSGGESSLSLRIGGWPVSAVAPVADVAAGIATAAADGLTSSIRSLLGDGVASVATRDDASPLGPRSLVPVLSFPVTVGSWAVALIELTGSQLGDSAPAITLSDQHDTMTAEVTWPDGRVTVSRLTNSGPALRADRQPKGPTTGSQAITKGAPQ